MNVRLLCAILIGVSGSIATARAAAPVREEVAALQSLYCVPDLPPTRVVAEFSRLLDKAECAWAMVKADIGTHLIGINDCIGAPVVPGTDFCKTFSFQINNMNSPDVRPGVPRFVLKGSGRWCRRIGGDWYADEPDRFATPIVSAAGPRLSDATCAKPADWGPRSLASLVPPPAVRSDGAAASPASPPEPAAPTAKAAAPRPERTASVTLVKDGLVMTMRQLRPSSASRFRMRAR